MTRPEILTWDYRQQPDMVELARIVLAMSGGTVHITPVETGGSEYAVVVSSEPFSALDAFKAYSRREEN